VIGQIKRFRHHSSKHFLELALHHGGKTAGIDMEGRNYVTIIICIVEVLSELDAIVSRPVSMLV